MKVHFYTVYLSFSTSAYILETCGIEIVLTITKVEVEPSSPCKVSLSKSGAFSLSGNKSSFSHGTLLGLLVVAIATVRRDFLQKLLFQSWLKKRLQMVINICSTL